MENSSVNNINNINNIKNCLRCTQAEICEMDEMNLMGMTEEFEILCTSKGEVVKKQCDEHSFKLNNFKTKNYELIFEILKQQHKSGKNKSAFIDQYDNILSGIHYFVSGLLDIEGYTIFTNNKFYTFDISSGFNDKFDMFSTILIDFVPVNISIDNYDELVDSSWILDSWGKIDICDYNGLIDHLKNIEDKPF